MRKLICGLGLSLGIVATCANAVTTQDGDGKNLDVATMMENCKSMSGAPEAQIACFTALSEMLKNPSGTKPDSGVSVPEALKALQAVASYQDDESGLLITGNACNVQIVYFGNYYHLSRRNVSTLDLFSAEFDASKLQYDQIVQNQGGAVPLSKGQMESGTTAVMRGGVGLDSAQYGFAAKSARATLLDYATEVVGQLQAKDNQSFDFVLVHPKHQQKSGEIWDAFKAFVTACRG